jgi:TolB-like protein/Tfp pilus assembly protein PilF
VPSSPQDLAAALADRYRLEDPLGRGGMATVYRAWDKRHDRAVALKVLHPEIANLIGSDRFLREIHLSARLQHPHILSVLDSGESAGRFWFTMPLVEGESLRDRLARERQLPLDDALRIAREVADALEYAHQHGVIHRDIKPDNIMLSGQHALVADFGIAVAADDPGPGGRLTETGLTLGTPHYMSPEQAAGERHLDARSDIYSLGCVLYEMLAGEPPFSGPNARSILAKRLNTPVPKLGLVRDIPAGVELAVTRSLGREPADRFPSAAAFAEALSIPAAVPPTSAKAGRRAAWALLALLVAGGGYLLARRAGAGAGAPVAASAAVLPFSDLSGGKDQEYFSDGLTEELITALNQVPNLRVAARTSSFQFKGKQADVRDVGRQLGVATVVEGTVRRQGDKLRVTAQLVSTRDGFNLWSSSYDRDMKDVFAVQEEIARAIAQALRVRLSGRADTALGQRPTTDLAAHDLYLKGLFALNQRTGASLVEAASYFGQAVARDSSFARAWAALASADLLLPLYAGVPPDSAWPRSRAAARRALGLDSTLAEAHTALAYGMTLYEWDWAAAEAEFRRAIAADPNYPTAHHWYGDFLAGRGRLEEALAELRRAQQLDPLSRIISVEVSWAYYMLHRYDEADSNLKRTLQLDPGYSHAFYLTGVVRMEQQRFPEAIAALKRERELGGFYAYATGALASAYAQAGHRDSALAVLDSMRARSKREYVPPFALVLGYTGLGDTAAALTWLEKAMHEKDVLLPENLFDPLLDPLRESARYRRVAERMGAASR